MNPPADSRDPSIDALRVGALLVCIAAHAAVPYLSAPIPELLWPVRQAPGSWAADLVFWWGRCAQPQLFFLLAGVTAASALDSRGPAAFALARLRRIGVPLLSGVVLVLPVVGLIWAWGWLDTGRATWIEVRSWRFSDPEIARNTLGPAHLWFLQDLLIMSVAVAAWKYLSTRGRWRLLSIAREVRLKGPALIGLALVSWTILIARPELLLVARNTFAPDVARIAFGATFFVAGLCLARDRRVLDAWPHPSFLLGGGAVSAVLVVSLISEAAIRPVALATSAMATSWFSVLGSLKLVDGRVLELPAVVQRLATSSYAIYVLHFPIVGAAHLVLYRLAANAVLAMALAFTGTLALTWLLVSGATQMAARAQRVGERVRRVPVSAWTTAAILLGIGLRLLQYLRNPAVNGSDLTWVMRLLPLAASCAALAVFLPMTRVIDRRMAPVAMLLMASSVKLIDHSLEAPPYALDVLLATFGASVFGLTHSWSVARRAVLLAAVATVVVWASYPGAFVMAGVVGSPDILDHGQSPVPAASILLALAVWAARSAIGIADYCFRPFGGVLLIPVAVGIAALVTQRRSALVVQLTLPLVLAAVVGVAGQDPFSGSRTMVYALPALAVLAAQGIGVILSRVPAKATLLRVTILGIALLPPVALCVRNLLSPSR